MGRRSAERGAARLSMSERQPICIQAVLPPLHLPKLLLELIFFQPSAQGCLETPFHSLHFEMDSFRPAIRPDAC